MFFQCRSGVWREDIILEDIDVQGCYDVAVKHSISGLSATGDPHSDYAGALYEYSSRRLTYESDILNAFQGVCNILAERMDTEYTNEMNYLNGLPVNIFDWALLWLPNDTARRRSGPWPSWSWCGRIGTIAMFLCGLDGQQLRDWLRDHTWIKWTTYDAAGRCLAQFSFNGASPRRETGFPTSGSPLAAPATPEKVRELLRSWSAGQGECSPILSGLLHFNTWSTHLRLAPTDTVIHHLHSADRSYAICDSSSTCCGTKYLDVAMTCDRDKAYEFIVLSDAKRSGVMGKETLSTLRGIEWDPSSTARGGEWDAYHVMLIDRTRNQEVAERVALGAMYREAIDNSVEPGTKWKAVWLR